MNDEAARKIWNQTKVPVVLNRKGKGQKLRLRLPFNFENRLLLGTLGRNNPTWNPSRKYWELPKAWLNRLIKALLQRFGQVYLIQTYVETEVCAKPCREAKGLDCSCSCGGANHGSGDNDRWYDVSDTLSFKRGEEHLAVRLLTRNAR